MRKLYILKTIVDFIWIMSWFALPLILILSVVMLFSSEPLDIPIQINGSTMDLSNAYDKYILPVGILYLCVLLYALFFFRKLLNNFRKRLIFENENAELLNKIGNLIIISSIIYVLFDLIIHYLSSKITITIGYGPFLYLLGLGLFFKVLAEVFKIGKTMKDENELTI
jgi:hypothetical protein